MRRIPIGVSGGQSARGFLVNVRYVINPEVWANEAIRVELGQALLGLRRYHALTQRELERLSGVDQTIISRLERGRHVHIRVARILALLAAMHVDRITFSSSREGASVAAFMSRLSDVGHSDVMRPPRSVR